MKTGFIQKTLSSWRDIGIIKKNASENLLEKIYELARQDHIERPALHNAVETSPLISFITPTFNTPTEFLADLINSFNEQIKIGKNCELILSDDGSSRYQTINFLREIQSAKIKVIFNNTNQGIANATNCGLRKARGKWIAFLDHDDALAPFAVDRIVRAFNEHPDCKFLYTDEIVADEKLRPKDIFFKPAWDPVLLSGVNYINHLSVYLRDNLMEIGGLREGYEGSQDYDLLLRYTKNLKPHEIKHLPYPAYYWRRTEKTFSSKFLQKATSNARRALSENFSNDNTEVPVDNAPAGDLHRIRFDLVTKNWPLVSVIIPTKDNFPLIKKVISGLRETDYKNLEIILVDNGTEERKVLDFYNSLKIENSSVKIIINKEDFNYARSINRGSSIAAGEYILFLNNDIEVQDANWLQEMVSCFSYEEVGIVGAKLIYPNHTLQHAGVMVGFGGLAGHWYIGQPNDFPGPQGRLSVRGSYSAVTGACLLASRKCIEAVGPLDEERFAIAYNDIDFCIRARNLGFRVIWTPFSSLIHHESATRGSDETQENRNRFEREKQSLRFIHQTDNYIDPASSPWVSRDRSCPIPIRNLSSLPNSR